jgi:hypothetical protein
MVHGDRLPPVIGELLQTSQPHARLGSNLKSVRAESPLANEAIIEG